MRAKELFQKDKALCDQWSAVCHAQWFEVVMVYALTSMTEGPISTEEMAGAKKLRDILMGLADDDTVGTEEPQSGFQHDVLGAVREARLKVKEK